MKIRRFRKVKGQSQYCACGCQMLAGTDFIFDFTSKYPQFASKYPQFHFTKVQAVTTHTNWYWALWKVKNSHITPGQCKRSKVCNNVEKDVCVDEFDKVCTMTSVKVCRKVAVREEVDLEDFPEGNLKPYFWLQVVLSQSNKFLLQVSHFNAFFHNEKNDCERSFVKV